MATQAHGTACQTGREEILPFVLINILRVNATRTHKIPAITYRRATLPARDRFQKTHVAEARTMREKANKTKFLLQRY
jgi:hypothetical protein